MTCKHTIFTAVDEDGCCSSCGKDLNPLFEKHCGGCPVLAENAKLMEEVQHLQDMQGAEPRNATVPRCGKSGTDRE